MEIRVPLIAASPGRCSRRRTRRRRLFAALTAALVITTVTTACGASGSDGGRPVGDPPKLAGCPVFPTDSAWNEPVNDLPVAADSEHLLARIGLDVPLHADFGTVYKGAPDGIPVNVISGHVRRVPVAFKYASQSDGRYYPLPRDVAVQGGPRSAGDRHLIVVDPDTCTDYELYSAYPHDHGRRWTAASGAIFNLRSNHLRPAGFTSADAAGLAILPGLARFGEVASGAIDHALRFTSQCSGPGYLYPARHSAVSCSGRSAPPMGLRVRLKAGVNISSLPYQARVVAEALKRYGMILADNGRSWHISGEPDPRWNDLALRALGRLTGRDFQVVDTSSLPHPDR